MGRALFLQKNGLSRVMKFWLSAFIPGFHDVRSRVISSHGVTSPYRAHHHARLSNDGHSQRTARPAVRPIIICPIIYLIVWPILCLTVCSGYYGPFFYKSFIRVYSSSRVSIVRPYHPVVCLLYRSYVVDSTEAVY